MMDFKKSIIRILLLVFICSIIWGCGKSEAVKNVEALIDGIGEVTVDSEESIKEAEEAYNVLTDKEKEQVENADQLSSKREELEACIEKKKEEERKKQEEEKKAELAPFVGTWKPLFLSDWMLNRNCEETKVLIIKEDTEFVKAPDKNVLTYVYGYNGGDLELVDDNGIIKLVSRNDVFVRVEDYNEAVDKEFVRVELDDDNVGDYIGELVKIGEYTYHNVWGDEEGTSDVYIVRSPAFEEQGLVYLSSRNVKYEMYINGQNEPVTFNGPYVASWGWFREPKFDHFGRAEGEIWYVRKEYVDDISETANSNNARKITFTDGFSADFPAFDTTDMDISVTDLEY